MNVTGIGRSSVEAHAVLLTLSAHRQLASDATLVVDCSVELWDNTIELASENAVPIRRSSSGIEDDGGVFLVAAAGLMRSLVQEGGVQPGRVASVGHGAVGSGRDVPMQDWIHPPPMDELGGLFAPRALFDHLDSAGWKFSRYLPLAFPMSYVAAEIPQPGHRHLLVLTQHLDTEHCYTMLSEAAKAVNAVGCSATARVHPKTSIRDLARIRTFVEDLPIEISDGGSSGPINDIGSASHVIAHWSTGLYEANAAGRRTGAFVGMDRPNYLAWPVALRDSEDIAAHLRARDRDEFEVQPSTAGGLAELALHVVLFFEGRDEIGD